MLNPLLNSILQRLGFIASPWWNSLPEPLRTQYRISAQPGNRPDEWTLFRLATQLGLDFNIAYRLMQPGPLPPRYRYRHFTIPKKDGSQREIVEPGVDLKKAQAKFLKLHLNRKTPHPAALGFRRKKSIADHAWTHAGAATIITADIEDFFPSTSRYRVKEWCHAQGYSTLETRLILALTTYCGSLPQGAPTSPPLSNLVNCELDAALERRSRDSGGKYSRYGDDMAFSWPDGCYPPADFEHSVRSILGQYGYRLHPQKGWHVWRRGEEPTVTGVVLKRRGDVDIPESMQRIMRELARSRNPQDVARLTGYIGYQEMVKRK